MFKLKRLFISFILIFSLSALLIPGSVAASQADTETPPPVYSRSLTGDRPSYLVIADDGETHVEFSISVKYPLRKISRNKEIYFTYTGDYDFYLFTRESAPIVSRRQNPGLFLEHKFRGEETAGFQRYRLGWYHESNGQNVETKAAYDAVSNPDDHISRGWDYLEFELKHKLSIQNNDLFLYAGVHYYCDCQAFGLLPNREDRIFWETVDEQPDIRDYNGLKFILNYITPNKKDRYSVMVRTGTNDLDALSNISYKVEAVIKLLDVPFNVFYFEGYGMNISTYHVRESYWGAGLNFW